VNKKSLILYASLTGNTEKVAMRFKQVFKKMAWECDMIKVGNNKDAQKPLIDYNKYDFLCMGSYVHAAMPNEVVLGARALSTEYKVPGPPPGTTDDKRKDPTDDELRKKGKLDFDPHAFAKEGGKDIRIVFGPQSKKGIVFVTYAGDHEGPREAIPPLALLEHEMGHLYFDCVGQFSCPGRFAGAHAWFKDLPTRPHERDLMKAQIFLEEILEEIEWLSDKQY